MINIKMIYRIMGFLILIETAMLVSCIGVSLYYQEDDIKSFLLTTGITFGIGSLLLLLGKNAKKQLSRKDGYLIVSFVWVIFSIFGMLPYYFSGYIPNITNAFFETMSGFTTTGASILDNIESLPHGLLFWRSMTQWIGGLGIVFFTITILPIFSIGSLQLFAAEATGPTHDKIHPRIRVTAKWLWSIYLVLTISETILLMFGGMSLFDAVCHSFTTTSTGGYSTKQASISYYNSPYIEYVVSVFMILSGLNFTLYFFCMKGKISKFFKDEEMRWFICSIAIFTGIIAFTLVRTSSMGIEESFRKALFQVASLHTATGFVTADYMTWKPFLWAMLPFAMICGGCAGSTSGGLKDMRVLILAKLTRNEFKHLIHPNAILPLRVNKQVISSSVKSSVLAFTFLYATVLVIGWLTMMALGVGFVESFGTVVSSMGGVGPGLGTCGPAYSWNHLPDAAKWLLSFLMLIGRLELFTVLIIFTPGFWKRH
ncbi:potassium transporter TrkG [uncultured Bacteroides sp.]|uniref:TrkH family potassium uptake protein n=1 Tax=uncultured Bacteroides sp. TaxID=162156 RepID=UPI002AA795F3|nr:potassium transporter TrkG [uncultured Bacteroides sp.]